MADITDPLVWSTLAQTVVLTLTFVIFIMSFRSQNKALREQAYEKVLDDYNDGVRMLLDKPELHSFQVELFNMNRRSSGREPKQYTREEMAIRNYAIMLYGFFERVYFQYRRKWIDEETWKQWSAFLELLVVHPVFRDVHESTPEMFDKPFVDYVGDILKHKGLKTAGKE